MKEKTDSNSKIKILGGAIILLVIGIGVVAFLLFQQNEKNEKQQVEAQEIIESYKAEMEDEYVKIGTEYDDLIVNLKNDSLIHQLENEKAKVQRLMEELRSTKASNAQEIKRLKDELNTLRGVLRSYVAQIDSLNKLNQQLAQENQVITSRYQETTKVLNQVSQEKESLSEKVTLASKLDASNISVRATNAKGKDQKNIKKIEQLIVSFVISKNITAQPGLKSIYVRIMKPDDDVLAKNRASTFAYENSQLTYSMMRQIEYTGEEVPVTLYWKVEEFLMPGTYRADIFADGNRIGSRSFTLQN